MRALSYLALDALLLAMFIGFYFTTDGDEQTFEAVFGFVALYLNGVLTGAALYRWLS